MSANRERWRWQELRTVLGPGVLLAAAAIGGSHLVASTQAGAIYGLGLLALVIMANLLKYPFMLVGTRFTAATGISLLEGYKIQNRFYLPLFLVITLATGVANIAAVTMIAGGLATTLLPGEASLWSLVLLGISLLVLLFGHYRSLDRISKVIVALLVLCTVLATAMALISGPAAGVVDFFQPSPWTWASLPFLVALMGWMPCPLDLAAWSSLWIFAREHDSGQRGTQEAIEADFNLGYAVTALMAVLFLLLGAWTMHGTGEQFSPQGGAFADQLIELYTLNIGVWAKPWIALMAFITMASTTITCLDGYPRSTSAGVRLLRGKRGHAVQNHADQQRWILLHAALAGGVLLIWPGAMRPLVEAAMIVSFLTTPVLAWMNLDLMQGRQVRPANRFQPPMVLLAQVGLLVLLSFTVLFVLSRIL